MKKLLLFILTSFSIFNFQTNENKIIGIWTSKEKEANQIEIYRDNNGLFQGIPATKNSDKTAKKAIKKLKYDAKTATYKGTMSPPDRDLELNVTISITKNGELKVVATKFIMSKTIYFTRTKE
jgi:hypothetical protein